MRQNRRDARGLIIFSTITGGAGFCRWKLRKETRKQAEIGK